MSTRSVVVKPTQCKRPRRTPKFMRYNNAKPKGKK